ncbi:hypothetical protein NLG97_g1331 [Lecanicillium saksenae]|uniref:Uncharacterized protein n=1 Tax=Lecanicillium saksenae TaxID=468837 RepID=A0ACC1R407_9HYPO|nr:hypothetical protein NLG97_g1331 [Lecanicillium saksenae]
MEQAPSLTLEERFAAIVNGTYRARSPSRRDPTMSWRNNLADTIEMSMEKYNHHKWGFVVYRTTYSDDEKWARVVCMLQASTVDTLEFYKGMDMMDSRIETIIEDASRLNGADSLAVREHFDQWVTENSFLENPHAAVEHQAQLPLAPRYRFAIQIDEASMNSILNEPTEDIRPGQEDIGWIKLIHKNWIYDPESDSDGDTARGQPPIEGITDEDVGWMKQNWRNAHRPPIVDTY